MEKKLQTEIIKWLKAGGAYVIKTRPGPGVPVGCPDIIALYRGRFAAIEVKAAWNSPDRPGQKLTAQRLAEHVGCAFRICPENWERGKQTIEKYLFQSAYGQ